MSAGDLGKELQRQQFPAPLQTTPVPEELLCAERLAKITRYTPVLDRSGPSDCGGIDLVQVDKVLMPDKSEVSLIPALTIRCAMAEQFAQFVRDDVGPAAAELGSPLMSITDLDSYSCRPRNNVKGAKLSEHGKGNAIDVNIVRLRNGGVFNLTDKLVSKPFRERLRTAACARFSTVLGPGSDAYHSSHVHLDIAERSRHYRICQWDVLDPVTAAQPPLPERKPAALKDANAKAQASTAQATKPSMNKPSMKTAPSRAQRRLR